MVKKSTRSTVKRAAIKKRAKSSRGRQSNVDWDYSPEAGDIMTGASYRGGLAGVMGGYRNPVYNGYVQGEDMYTPAPVGATTGEAQQRIVRTAMQRVIKEMR